MNLYLNHLIKLRRGPELLSLGIFPNAKEVTESFAAYNAVLRHLNRFSLSDSEVALVVVGDGTTPRTATTFAFRSAWQCHSIDPKLTNRAMWSRIDRLTTHKAKAEDVRIKCKRAVVVAVHSHAPLQAAINTVKGAEEIGVVAIPCCFEQKLFCDANIVYEDAGIDSPKRSVYVWQSVG